MDTGLKGRGVIVAASSTGIGRATAEAFAREGAQVAMCARRVEALNAAADDIRSRYQGEIYAQALDVTDPSAVRDFVSNVSRRFGRVDVCVTNAGGPPAKNFLSLQIDEWRKAFESNLLSTVYFAREVIPLMQRHKWGRIVTITSNSVKQPIQDLVLSNSIRAGAVGLVKSLANEFGKDGITVNNVGPGYTGTDRLNELAEVRALAAGVSTDEVYKGWAAGNPLQRIGKPEEIADAIVFLASDRASYITGQTLLVDGGSYRGL
jgi:3-oxoacyl-[acyl-carrier protein] reductase